MACLESFLTPQLEGSFSKKNDIEAYELLEDMARNGTLWPSERLQPTKRVASVHNLDVFNNLAAQVSILTKQLQSNQMTANAVHTHPYPICELENSLHQNSECLGGNPFELSSMEQAQYIWEYSKYNNPHSNQYNPG